MEPYKTRWLVLVMLIIDGLASQEILNPFHDYFGRYIEGLRNIDLYHHSMCTGRKEKRYVLTIV